MARFDADQHHAELSPKHLCALDFTCRPSERCRCVPRAIAPLFSLLKQRMLCPVLRLTHAATPLKSGKRRKPKAESLTSLVSLLGQMEGSRRRKGARVRNRGSASCGAWRWLQAMPHYALAPAIGLHHVLSWQCNRQTDSLPRVSLLPISVPRRQADSDTCLAATRSSSRGGSPLSVHYSPPKEVISQPLRVLRIVALYGRSGAIRADSRVPCVEALVPFLEAGVPLLDAFVHFVCCLWCHL